MSQTEIETMRRKIFKALTLARKKAVADALAYNTQMVTSENGRVKLVDPRKIKKIS